MPPSKPFAVNSVLFCLKQTSHTNARPTERRLEQTLLLNVPTIFGVGRAKFQHTAWTTAVAFPIFGGTFSRKIISNADPPAFDFTKYPTAPSSAFDIFFLEMVPPRWKVRQL